MYIKLNEAKDSIGQDININDKVAYNRSGNVVPGVVIDIMSYKRYGNSQIKFKIKNLKDIIFSYVLDGMSILVLEKGNKNVNS